MSRVRVPEGVPKARRQRTNQTKRRFACEPVIWHMQGPLVKWSKTPASHAGNMGSNPVRVTRIRRLRAFKIVGVYSDEVPPVPIPNTVVKLICAENTWRAAARENRTMPTLYGNSPTGGLFFCFNRSCFCLTGYPYFVNRMSVFLLYFLLFFSISYIIARY